MKKLLVVIGIVAAVLIVYFLLTPGNRVNDALNSLVNPETSDNDAGRSTGAPSATDSGTYTLDKKASSVSMSYASKKKTESWGMSIQSGEIIMNSGNVSGGTVLASMSELKRTGLSFDTIGYPNANLDLKAVVFDQLKSSTDRLVFRVDTELTMNGKTNPLSFVSTYEYSTEGMSMVGTASPDWKLWGVEIPAGESMSLNISLNFVK